MLETYIGKFAASVNGEFKDIAAIFGVENGNVNPDANAVTTVNGIPPDKSGNVTLPLVDPEIHKQLTETVESIALDLITINDSIATNTANFVGTFDSVEDLNDFEGDKTNNDYAFVRSTDEAGNNVYNRYKYSAADDAWKFEYTLNNSSFTAAQWNAVNSGITAYLVQKLAGTYSNSDIDSLLSEKQAAGDYALRTELPVMNKNTIESNLGYKVSVLTQAEYDSIAIKDGNTFYYIKE